MSWCCITGDGISIAVKLSTSKFKIRYNFMGSSLMFQFLYINVLITVIFTLNVQRFFKIKNVGKIKKTLKRVFYRKVKKRL